MYGRPIRVNGSGDRESGLLGGVPGAKFGVWLSCTYMFKKYTLQNRAMRCFYMTKKCIWPREITALYILAELGHFERAERGIWLLQTWYVG